jgi:hypothetical protein
MTQLGIYPDALLVSMAWIRSIPGLAADYVDERLPWDLNVPVQNGYVQVTEIGGGAPHQNIPLFSSTIQVDCWVESPSEDRTYRLQASALAQQIIMATYDRQHIGRALSLRAIGPEGMDIEYPNAHVFSAYVVSFVHDMPNTVNPVFAGNTMDMTFTWAWDTHTL